MKKNDTLKYDKSVKLINSQGTLFLEYENVDIEHWSENVYKIFTNINGVAKIIRLHKSTDSTLLIE